MTKLFWTQDKINVLRDLWTNPSFSVSDIATELKTSYDAVKHALRRYNLTHYRTVKKDKASSSSTQKMLEDIDPKVLEKLKKECTLNWKVPKGREKITKNKKWIKYIVIGDAHVPKHNEPCIKSILQLMDDEKFDGMINLGDYMDMEPISHWTKNKRKTLEGRRLLEDYVIGNTLLDEFDKRLPSNAYKYYLNGNHECLDKETECLTKRGWLNYKDIQKNDKVLSFNPKTERGEWVNIDYILIKSHSGVLNRIKTATIDLLATDDHRMFAKDRATGEYVYTSINDIRKKRYLIPLNTQSKKKDYNISDNELKLIAWILTDGHITKEKYIKIYQSKNKYRLIQSLLNKMSLDYSIRKRERNITEICGKKLKSIQTQYEFHIKANSSRVIMKLLDRMKKLPLWVKKLSEKQFDIFLNGLIDGDGSRHKNSETSMMLYGKKDFLEQVQLQAILNGYSASLSVYRKVQYRLNLVKRTMYNFELKNNWEIKKEKYSGDVWDLTVKNHNFMIRRNGKCHFTGNCWYDQFIEELPALEGFADPTKELKLIERGYKVFPYNHIEHFGRLSVTHGIYATTDSAKKHLDELKTNVMFGHTHTQAEKYSSSEARTLSMGAYNLGALCDMAPDYMRGRPHKWTHGFAILYVEQKTGYFFVDLKRIVGGRFIHNNKIYNGNK